jgi:8-oxo-dGTP pyrophosphatase MutT (NUDIX family)
VGWEIPAGVVEKGESILAGARREAREESGYDTTGHRLLYAFFPNHGISNIRFHVVQCRAGSRQGGWDRDEVKGRRWFSKPQVRRLLARGAVLDSFSLVALLLWLQSFKKDKMKAAGKGGF